MKWKTLIPMAAAFAVLFTGCWQKSIHPFCQDIEAKFDEKLVGTWHETEKEGEKGMYWKVSKGEMAETYRIQIEDGDTKLDYDGRLFKLGEDRLLDLHSRTRGIAEAPAHNLFRVQIGSTLKAELLNPDWIAKRLKDNPQELAHIKLRDPESPNDDEKVEIVLTATTDQLQKFLRAHSGEKDFWSESGEFKKVPNK